MTLKLIRLRPRFLSPGNIGKLIDDFAVHTYSDMHGKHQSLGSTGEVVDISEIVYSMIVRTSWPSLPRATNAPHTVLRLVQGLFRTELPLRQGL